MKIADRAIGPGEPVYLVSEIGVTANGDVDRAKALIEATAAAGADAVKFICTSPSKIMASRAPEFTYDALELAAIGEDGSGRRYELRPRTRPLYDLLAETEFPPEAWPALKAHADQCGVTFFVTVDYLDAIPMLTDLTAAWKVSAWDIAWLPLIHALRATGKPVLVDVGTATRAEVLAALPDERELLFVHAPHPHGHADWQMSRLCGFFRADYPVGFSSPGRASWCDYLALGGGACLLEKRITLRRDEPRGHHHAVSLEPAEFREWVRSMREADLARREDPFGGTTAAWAERARFNRNAHGLRP
jgi:sialic acid synthase SpsE